MENTATTMLPSETTLTYPSRAPQHTDSNLADTLKHLRLTTDISKSGPLNYITNFSIKSEPLKLKYSLEDVWRAAIETQYTWWTSFISKHLKDSNDSSDKYGVGSQREMSTLDGKYYF